MNEREIVVTPEQYAKLEAELVDFQRRHGKSVPSAARELFGPVKRLDPAALVERYPAPNRKQRRAMAAVARRMR